MSKDHRESTKERIAVMQAYVDGAEIEVRNQSDLPDTWCAVGIGPLWDWVTFAYRVKQKTPQDIAREQAAVMLAWADGKQIQHRYCADNHVAPWNDFAQDQVPLWMWSRNDYRIKPEDDAS